MEAKIVTLAGLLGDDIKHVLAVVGLNLTGVTVSFELSVGPEQPAIVTAIGTLLDVSAGDDVSTSVIQIFKAAADVRTAVTAMGGLPGNESTTLFYQLKFSKIPGDAGSDAVTTILFGDYLMKGEVNG